MAANQTSLMEALRQRAEAWSQTAHELSMKDHPAEAIALYDKIIALLRNRLEPEFQESLASAMLRKGEVLSSCLNLDREAIAIFDALILRFGDNSQHIKPTVAGAFSAKAFAHHMLGEYSEESAAYDAIIRQYSLEPIPDHPGWEERHTSWLVRFQVTSAYRMKVSTSSERCEYQDALHTVDALLDLLSQPNFVDFQDDRAEAMFGKGVLLARLNRRDEAIAAYSKVVQEFGKSAKPKLRFAVAKCLFNMAQEYGDFGNLNREAETYRNLVARYGSDRDLEMHGEVAMTRVNLGHCLAQLGRYAEAIEQYDRVIDQHRKSGNPEIRTQVEKARSNRKYALEAMS